MPQAVTTTIVGALLALVSTTYARGDTSPASGSVDQARRLVEAKDYAGAMTVLEDLLIDANTLDKPAITGLLKQTYETLARQAQAAGRDRDAAHYRDNIAILGGTLPDAILGGTVPGSEPARPARRAPAVPADSKPPRPETARRATRPPPWQPAHPHHRLAAQSPARRLRSCSGLRLSPSPQKLRRPNEAADDHRRLSQPNRPGPPRASRPALTRSYPALPFQDGRGCGDSTTGSRLVRERFDCRGKPPCRRAQPPAQPPCEQADQLFSARKYSEAGRFYAALARENRLPPERTKHWAYCRMVEVAQRINGRPRSSREWDQIEAEIEEIQRLAPRLWYGEYLRKFVAEARAGRRVSLGRSDNLIVRGSAPDENEAAQSEPERSRRLFGKSQTQTPAQMAIRIPPSDSTAAANSSWQVHETVNFRIFHCSPRLAEQAGVAAEKVRASQGRRWGSPAIERPWTPRCDLYLYPDGRSLARATGQPETAPGFSTLNTDGSRVTIRRTVLRADHPQLLTAVLPHEITHVVVADLFTAQCIPRWADEGIAVLAEPDAEQDLRVADLHDSLESGRILDLAKLMTSEEPPAADWSQYYAQSVSLTRFLVEQGSPERFLQFVRKSSGKGTEAALRDVYKIGGLADLRDRWMAYARRQVATLEQSRRDTGARSAVARSESGERDSQ